jgi:biotin-(acetyl-CoA carboxylase) ligase
VCGKKVRVQMMGGVVVGTARDIDTDGALIVEDGRGMMRRIVAGDVIPL